ncbi:MAG TPA: hypothetical protein VM661_17325 [Candidatus Sulfotelmatobacter sp.]|jgi:hypothetical protein|nr:hypothetical protein [Candidatus Sulfotelmatobacter sp.]
MSVVGFNTLSAYQGSGIAAALWGQSLSDRNNRRQDQNATDQLNDLTAKAATASTGSLGPLLRQASSALENISASAASQDDQTNQKNMNAFNGLLSQLAALAPKAGAAVSKLAAETIDSLNSQASALARSLGVYWSDVSVMSTNLSAPGITGSSRHTLDIYA